MSKARPRRAMALPMWPRPKMPSLLPVIVGQRAVRISLQRPSRTPRSRQRHSCTDAEQKRPRLLGDRRRVEPDAVGDHDAALARRGEVDAFEARADDADDLERGQRLDVMPLDAERAVGLHGADALARSGSRRAAGARRGRASSGPCSAPCKCSRLIAGISRMTSQVDAASVAATAALTPFRSSPARA